MPINPSKYLDKAPDIDHIISQKGLPVPEGTLNAPFEYLQLLPSNNNKVRSKFLVGFNEKFFHITDTRVISEIGAVIETLHGASLLIDDIEDDSTFRRGQPCAHITCGLPATINSGNLMYFTAMQRALTNLPTYLESTDNDSAQAVFRSQLLDIFMDEMINLHVGQGFDIYWRDNFLDVMNSGLPSIEEYLEVVMHKTGGLFRLAVRMLSLFADGMAPNTRLPNKLVQIASLLGIVYQIRDDYINLADEEYAELKGSTCEDLIEGKMSLPILYTLIHQGESSPLFQLYREAKSPEERRADVGRLEAVSKFIADSGALDYSYSILQEYVQKAKALIESEGDDSSNILSDILTKLSIVGTERKRPAKASFLH